MDKSREIAEEILELFRQPHIDVGTPLEDIHLVESIADIIEENLNQEYKDGVSYGEQNPRCA
jgi:hypothetical protein